MADCPLCGESLVKGPKSKYYCENEGCPVIFVQCPYEPAKRRVAYSSVAGKETIEKIEKLTIKNTSHLF